jgi:hypothetical protein
LFQKVFQILILGEDAILSTDPSSGEGSHVNEVKSWQEITVRLNNVPDRDDAALLLEVVAGEIRKGRECGDNPECSWNMRQE